MIAGPPPTDADGDSLSVVYRWRRNGTEVAGRTGPILPASETTHYDVIDVVATASDGAAVASATAPAVTIRDSLPTLRAPTAPPTATFGSMVTFTVTVEDVDGDPIPPHTLKVAAGPPGMAIGAGGVVTWIPTGIKFGPLMDFRWSIVAEGLPGNPSVAGKTSVYDPSGRSALLRTANVFGYIAHEGLEIGDFDRDGDSEILVLGDTVHEYQWTGSGYEIVWSYPFAVGTSSPTTMATRDIDGDGRPEIFLASGASLVRLDGMTRRPEPVGNMNPVDRCMEIEVADLTGDGVAEIICAARQEVSGDGSIVVMAATGRTLIHQSAAFNVPQRYYKLAVGNVDNDAALEIVSSEGYVYDGATFALEWTGPIFGGDVAIGDVTGDGIGDIVAVTEIGGKDGVDVHDAVRRTRVVRIPAPEADALLLANLDASTAALEIIAAGGIGVVEAYRYDAAAQTVTTLFHLDAGGTAGANALAYGNADGDAEVELALGSYMPYVVGLGAPVAVDWPNDPNPHPVANGPFFGGVLARGPLGNRSLLFAGGGGADARVVQLAPSGAIAVSPTLAESQSFSVPLIVASYDNDLTDEVLIATDHASHPKSLAYDFFGSNVEWSSSAQSEYEYPIAVAGGDLTDDGHTDFVVLTRFGRLQVFDVFLGSLAGQVLDLFAAGVAADVAVANLDADPRPEIIAAGGTQLVVVDVATSPFSMSVARRYTSPNELLDVSTGDTDGDGALEIFALGVRRPAVTDSARIERLTPALAAIGEIDTKVAGSQVIVEESPFVPKNLIVATRTNAAGFLNDAFVAAFDPASGMEIWRSPSLLGAVTHNSIAYVQLDNETEKRLAFGTAAGMYLTP